MRSYISTSGKMNEFNGDAYETTILFIFAQKFFQMQIKKKLNSHFLNFVIICSVFIKIENDSKRFQTFFCEEAFQY